RRAGFYPVHGRVHRAQGSAAQCLDGGLRWHWWTDARLNRRARVQFHWRIFRHSDFLRARLVRLFFESIQPDASWHARWRPHRHRIIALVVDTRLCAPALVRMEVSELHCLVDGDRVAAADLFPLPQTHRRRTTLL